MSSKRRPYDRRIKRAAVTPALDDSVAGSEPQSDPPDLGPVRLALPGDQVDVLDVGSRLAPGEHPAAVRFSADRQLVAGRMLAGRELPEQLGLDRQLSRQGVGAPILGAHHLIRPASRSWTFFLTTE